MEPTEFFEHYRVTSEAISRTGPAANYKAIDKRTDETVMLQVVPLAHVDQSKRLQFEERVRIVQELDHINVARVRRVESDDRYLGLVSEFVEGETLESWIVEHGPMPADAVLRVGLQVVRALGAAAFLGLSHRAIAPGNIMIMRGEIAEGGWPFVKLLNFGLAGLAIYDDPVRDQELAADAPPPFCSPEQLLDKPIDFRSEMYSLGATMCYLLTAAVPLAVGGMKARLRARRLPELRRAPAALRNLLVHMLRENPDNRPQDPVAFEAEVRECLRKVERRQALGRRLGIPLATVIPRRPKRAIEPGLIARSTVEAELDDERSTSVVSPTAQIIRGAIAFAALVLVGGVIAAFFLPEDVLPFRHHTADKIGVPIGVPSPAEVATTNQSAPPMQSPIAVAANNVITPAPAATVATVAVSSPPPRTIAQASASPPPPPAEGPVESSQTQSLGAGASNSIAEASSDNSASNPPNESQSNASDEERPAPTPVKKKTVTTSTSSTHRSSSTASRERVANSSDEPPTQRRGIHARVVGTTSDGRTILRLPSGRTVAVHPGHPDEDVDLSARSRRRAYVPRDPDAPYQPFDPNAPNN